MLVWLFTSLACFALCSCSCQCSRVVLVAYLSSLLILVFSLVVLPLLARVVQGCSCFVLLVRCVVLIRAILLSTQFASVVSFIEFFIDYSPLPSSPLQPSRDPFTTTTMSPPHPPARPVRSHRSALCRLSHGVEWGREKEEEKWI